MNRVEKWDVTRYNGILLPTYRKDRPDEYPLTRWELLTLMEKFKEQGPVSLKFFLTCLERGITQLHVSFVEEAQSLSFEEKAEVMLALLDVDESQCTPYVEPPEWWSELSDGKG